MENRFFEKPILNSPYKYSARHWELDASGQPTQRIIEKRRRAEFITPIVNKLGSYAAGPSPSSPRRTKSRPTSRPGSKRNSTN